MMNPSDPLKACFLRLKCRSNAQAGHVAVIAALCMTVLLGIFAFLANVGFLYADKNRYQNAVEAAAMAGVSQLCGEDPEGTAMDILLQNLFPDGYEGEEPPEGYTVDIATGYYDESGEADLSGSSEFGYRSFVEAENMPSDVYANSLLVRLSINHNAILPGLVGKDEVPLQVVAVAYLKRYGMLSLGEESGDGITFTNFFDSEPIITGGDIHANNNISFGASPDIDSSSVMVTASGNISGYGSGISGVDPISLKPISAYLENLYARADIIITENDFPDEMHTGEAYIRYEDEDAYYRENETNRLIFIPHTGDHGGMIYYFAGDVDVMLGNSNSLGDGNDPEEEITHLTFAADKSIIWHSGGNEAWGGENENQVTIIAGEDIDFFDAYSDSVGNARSSDATFESRGVVFLAGRDIIWNNAVSYTGGTYNIRNLRMIAEGSIEIDGPGSWMPVEVTYNMAFGPPCPPNDIRLGRLVTP